MAAPKPTRNLEIADRVERGERPKDLAPEYNLSPARVAEIHRHVMRALARSRPAAVLSDAMNSLREELSRLDMKLAELLAEEATAQVRLTEIPAEREAIQNEIARLVAELEPQCCVVTDGEGFVVSINGNRIF